MSKPRDAGEVGWLIRKKVCNDLEDFCCDIMDAELTAWRAEIEAARDAVMLALAVEFENEGNRLLRIPYDEYEVGKGRGMVNAAATIRARFGGGQ